MNDEVKRETVSVGLDFRPVPLDLGDNVVWEFEPDPSSQQWQVLSLALKGFSSLASEEKEDFDVTKPMDALTDALVNLLVRDDQKKLWREKGYGLMPMQKVATVLMEQWTGFPTKQPSNSGKG